MQPQFDFITIVLFLGAAQGVLLAVAMLTIPRGNRTANRILAVMLLLFAFNIVLHILSYSRYLIEYPHFAKIEPVVLFMFGPLLFLYGHALVHRDFQPARKHLWHFFPAVICIGAFTPFYLQSAQEKVEHIISEMGNPCMMCLVTAWLVLAQILVYIFATVTILRKHETAILQTHSSIEKINLKWLRTLLVAFAAVWVVGLIMQISSSNVATKSYIWLLFSINVYLIGYFGLRQPEIFSGEKLAGGKDVKSHTKKYEKSTLTPELAEQYFQKLTGFMKTEKPFLRGDLTLPALSKQLSISLHHLSRIINERLEQNFFEFVNSYRVEEAKKLLVDPDRQNINLAEIGFDAGFNSISAFNAAFKKHTGMTPSQFRDANVE